jgi:hypothetical protein
MALRAAELSSTTSIRAGNFVSRNLCCDHFLILYPQRDILMRLTLLGQKTVDCWDQLRASLGLFDEITVAEQAS